MPRLADADRQAYLEWLKGCAENCKIDYFPTA